MRPLVTFRKCMPLAGGSLKPERRRTYAARGYRGIGNETAARRRNRNRQYQVLALGSACFRIG